MKDDDFKLLKGFALRRTDERTNGRTFAIVESLSRMKKVSQKETLFQTGERGVTESQFLYV